MPRRHITIATVALAIFLIGCGPESSLFPLYGPDDTYFDPRLNGAWRMQDSPKVLNKDDLHLMFKEQAATKVYLVTGKNPEKRNVRLLMEAHLLHLGKYTFIDFGTPSDRETEEMKIRDEVFPRLSSHMFARVRAEASGWRLDFLDEKWIDDKVKAGRLKLAHVEVPGGFLLSAPTADLRQFALEHAEDDKAFSFTEYLVREK